MKKAIKGIFWVLVYLGLALRVFKKARINIARCHAFQVRFKTIPLVQYERYDNGDVIRSFPFRKKHDKDKVVFYLKFHNDVKGHAFYCLGHWINIVNKYKGDYYIVCDKPRVELDILRKVVFYDGNIKFITSDKSIPKYIIENVATSRWIGATYGHLTTFLHAKKHGIKRFWNIDADDTSFMELPLVVAKSLKKVADYANKHDISLFSLDMHRTNLKGKHWSYGVTYVRKYDKFLKLVYENKSIAWRNKYKLYDDHFNLDWFTTYLRDKKALSIETFTINNLYFMHWGMSHIFRIFPYFMYVVRDGILTYPILLKVFNNKKYGEVKVYKDCINLDTGIKEKDSLCYINNLIAIIPLILEERMKHKTKSAK
ncbi:hypothetical protein BKH43_02520 [Helicobacter sp. 13S00401-1]|uniref:hypothetical protein n=1 Tax=Helicobacter sp. 13S00401-1 TaxID=1905758 RepID=UPI000BA63062|nr:hypothetical protein [Helicobacter sp. 13S00401-1]PAF51099.1 hypothetical protein BKH43_02520 [Helicobacter sp. 13S00401-1]